MLSKDVVVGKIYKYANLSYPGWLGLEFKCTEKDSYGGLGGIVTKVAPHPEVAHEYPLGAYVKFSSVNVEPASLSVVESMFE